MQRLSCGFSLIEFLVYITLSSLATMLIFSFTYQSINHSIDIKKDNSLEAMLCSCCAFLAHDIKEADAQTAHWQLSDNGIIFQMHTTSIAWQKEDNKIYRISGMYDFALKQWGKKNKALVMQSANEFSASLERVQQSVKAVMILVSAGFKKKQQKIYLVNRVIA